MEQIDYKKKYEEAIERLKQWDREHRSGYTIQERDEFIFPELRESEDEKNIDFLIHLIEHNVPNHSFAFGDGCAYGYKSKEEAINMLKSIRYRIISQPKQEWSEEDESRINRICSILRQAADTHAFSTSCRLIGDKECIELQDFLKSLTDRYLPQPKTEWSEEDTEHIKSILERLDGMCKKGATFTRTRFAVSEDQDWLRTLKERYCPQKQWKVVDKEIYVKKPALAQRKDKSEPNHGYVICYDHTLTPDVYERFIMISDIYPQKHWKPSEKQIEAIRIAAEVGTANNSWAMNVLKELYEQINNSKRYV